MTSIDAPSDRRNSSTDVVAGFLAVASIVLSLFAMGLGLILEVDARPARTAFVAIILALVSARLSARYQSLALKAALFAMLAWVVGIVSWECMTLRRKRTRRREAGSAPLDALADAADNPEERAIRVELEAVAVAALGQLRPEDRETLQVAIYGEGPRDARPATFRKRVERAMGRLRAAWRDHGIG